MPAPANLHTTAPSNAPYDHHARAHPLHFACHAQALRVICHLMKSVPLFSLLQIRVRADAGAALLIVLLAVSFSRTGATGAALGAALGVGILICLLVHELGHAIAVRSLGFGGSTITLSMFGGVCSWHANPTPAQRIVVAVAGPAATALCAGACFVLARAVMPSYAGAILTQLTQLNLLWLAFNLLPVLPLDGGTIVHSLLLMRLPEPRASLVGHGISFLFATGAAVAAWYYKASSMAVVMLALLAWRSIQYFQHARRSSSPPEELPP